MLLAVLTGFLLAIVLTLTGNLFNGKRGIILSLLPLSLFVYFLSKIPEVASGFPIYESYRWIPAINVNFSFYLDGLSLLFCLLITGIGTLIYLYGSNYLKNHHHFIRFFAFLSIFMGAMLGLVLSDNVLTLFVFWELTSISSFFLIGFNHDNPASRKSALTALAVTAGGGFLLLSGFILMGSISGTYSILEMLQTNEVLKNHGYYGLILFFLFGGAFTKSAQFPFHFWLPGAMKAPTPVSAYLHSATMVKAGIYLLARFTPVLGDHTYWNTTLMIFGGITMLYAALHAIFQTDLKSILAYSTVSALGILVFLLGIGTQQALVAVAVFILVHALYKAGLFLVAGAIDHSTNTRDVVFLNGLRRIMLPVFIAGLLAALSNAGIPFTFGFLGKDLIYEATLHTGELGVLLTAAAVITNICLLYAGFLVGLKPFTGNIPEQIKDDHAPHFLLWMPSILLGAGGIIFGMFPAIVDQSIVQPIVLAMHRSPVDIPLKIWHGFNLILILSIVTVTAGVILYLVKKPSYQRLEKIRRFDVISPQQITTVLSASFERFSLWYTRKMQNRLLRIYVLVILVFIVGLLAYQLFNTVNIYIEKDQFLNLTFYEAVVAGIMLTAILITISTLSRLTAVASMGVVGYCICLMFVFYSAPDLAMTQFTIETLTVVLFVLVLFKLPPFMSMTNRTVKIRDGIVSLAFGFVISIIALEVLNEPVTKEISHYYGANSYVLAKGKNVVNVILVDFRGVDTIAEISVLAIAAIGVYSLLKLEISSWGKNKL